MEKTKSCLSSQFEMKDMGEASYVLGIKIIRNREYKLLYLDQKKYLEKLLDRFNMGSCKTVKTLVCKGLYLNKDMCPKDEAERKKNVKNPLCPRCGEPHVCYDKYKTRHFSCSRVSK